MRLVALIAPLVLISSQGAAETWSIDQWRFIGSGSNKMAVFFKIGSARDLPATLVRRFPVRQAWIGYDYTAVKTERARKALTMYRVDCAGERMMIVAQTTYAASGEVMKSRSNPDDYDFEYEPVTPESVGSSILEAVCSSGQ